MIIFLLFLHFILSSCSEDEFIIDSKLTFKEAISGIDINPLQNPHIKNGKSFPENATYNSKKPGTLTTNSKIGKESLKRG